MSGEPSDYNLIALLIPEEVDPHAVARLTRVASLNVKLKHSAIVASRWIINEIGIALLTGSGFIDGTGKIHAIFCQRSSKGLIAANPHATVAVFIGEDKKSLVYHLRLDIFRFPDSPLCAWMENQTSCKMLTDPVRHGIIFPGNRHVRIKLFVTSLTFQMVAQNINLPTQGNIFIPVEFRDFPGLFHFGQPIRIFFFRRVQFPLKGGDMMVQCGFARRCIGKVRGVSQFQFRSKNPGLGNEIQPAPVCPVGGCSMMDDMGQE